MAEYQRIEYRLGNDGTITETVLNASGVSCTEATTVIEQALGTVESQEFLPAYYEEEETLNADTDQSLKQASH
jgi:Protein of unknown function (DUF2997)